MRCKNCRNKFIQKVFNEKYCEERDCQIEKKTQQGLVFLKAIKKNELATQKAFAYSKKYKKDLDSAVQMIARMIDNRFGYRCIDCDKPFGKQQDGGHFKSKGHNASLRWNLHNIHSQMSNCNQNGLGGGREREYYEGLVKRYGREYAEFIDNELQQLYPTIKLKEFEVVEKLAIVRKLIRTFDTFEFNDGKQAREQLNTVIGIYTKSTT